MAAVTTSRASMSATDSSDARSHRVSTRSARSAWTDGRTTSGAGSAMGGDVTARLARPRSPTIRFRSSRFRPRRAPPPSGLRAGRQPLGHQRQPVHGLDHGHPDVAAAARPVQLTRADQESRVVGEPFAQGPAVDEAVRHRHPQVEATGRPVASTCGCRCRTASSTAGPCANGSPTTRDSWSARVSCTGRAAAATSGWPWSSPWTGWRWWPSGWRPARRPDGGGARLGRKRLDRNRIVGDRGRASRAVTSPPMADPAPDVVLPSVHADLAERVETLWDRASELSVADIDALDVVTAAIDLLDSGEARIAEVDPTTDQVVVHQWLKHAILLLFRLRSMETIELGPFEFADKVPLKHGYEAAGVRVVPGASARWGSYLAPGVICMPSYVNIGARVGAGTMVDTWATVGSCAQIGENVHLSGGVGIGGVLEPAQAAPVIIEDEVMIGSRCMITQGARVGRGSVVGEGTILNPSIPVIDAETGDELGRGHVPPWSVAVQASRRREFPGGEFYLPCVLVLKRLTEGQRHDKAQLNDILRTHGVST